MSSRFPPLPEVEPPTLVVPPETAAAIAALGVQEVRVVDESGAPLGRLRTRAHIEAMRRALESPSVTDEELDAAAAEGEACGPEELWAYLHRDRTRPWVGEAIPQEGPAVLRGADPRGEEPGRNERKEAA